MHGRRRLELRRRDGLTAMLTRGGRPAISVVVPLLDERPRIPALMATLEPFVGLHELVLVDGGSTDGTWETLVERGVGTVLRAPRGRGRQLNAGAEAASGHVLLFLHADTGIAPEGPEHALRAIDRGADAGCFSLRIQSRHRRLAVAGALISLRSRLLPSATGDQAIFLRADVFRALGGFDPRWPVCEDLELVRRFVIERGPERFVCLAEHVETSGRRWERRGVTRTMVEMWLLRAAFHLGVSPEALRGRYPNVRDS
jgi:rSAM/selenodomain-associated transferase 2